MRKKTYVINECEQKPQITIANSISAAIMNDGLGMHEQPPLLPIALSLVLPELRVDFRALHHAEFRALHQYEN